MRVREWYSWHFPELVRIVPDNYTYARLALAIQEKGSLSDDRKEELSDITGALPSKAYETLALRPNSVRGHGSCVGAFQRAGDSGQLGHIIGTE